MAFSKDKQYWERRLKNNKEALKGSRKLLKDLTLDGLSDRHIESHKSYINDLVKSQKEIRKELAA